MSSSVTNVESSWQIEEDLVIMQWLLRNARERSWERRRHSWPPRKAIVKLENGYINVTKENIWIWTRISWERNCHWWPMKKALEKIEKDVVIMQWLLKNALDISWERCRHLWPMRKAVEKNEREIVFFEQ